jgi:hypothetical protein
VIDIYLMFIGVSSVVWRYENTVCSATDLRSETQQLFNKKKILRRLRYLWKHARSLAQQQIHLDPTLGKSQEEFESKEI